MDGGLPTKTLNEFDYINPSTNLNKDWIHVSSIDKYSSYGKPMQFTVDGNGKTSIVYGKEYHLLIGKIINAEFQESGVFTGDYQNSSDPNYWDYENGWEIGTAASGGPVSLVSDATDLHFGHKVIKVENNYAAGRNNVITPGKAYKMSTWVKVTNGPMDMAVSFHSVVGGIWPVVERSSHVEGKDIWATPVTATGEWQLMTLDIPASWTRGFDDTKTWIARAWVGNVGNEDNVGFVDDIRFAPEDAMITSIYYDPTWQKPVVSVDANNNPGKKVEYDDFGRPVRWYKVDKNNPSNNVLVQKKEYHLRNELPEGKHIQVLYPDGGENYTGASTVSIQWVNDDTRDVVLAYKLKTGETWGSWTQIATRTAQSGWSSYDWSVPTGTANDCMVKAEISGVESDESDRAFYVSSPVTP